MTTYTVSYLTDVEGNLDYFNRFVRISEALSYEENSPRRALRLEDGFAFVFGGDLFDKGSGDIRLCRLLCDLKERYPNRVYLLGGNRDLNKLRISAELSRSPDECHIGQRLWDQKPFWDAKAPSLTEWLPIDKARRRMLEVALLSATPAAAAAAAAKPASHLRQLRWMLECTLGCPMTFEYRREEL